MTYRRLEVRWWGRFRSIAWHLACEQAHLFGVSCEHLGGESAICELAKPARRRMERRKPLFSAGSQIADPPPRYSHETQTSEPARRLRDVSKHNCAWPEPQRNWRDKRDGILVPRASNSFGQRKDCRDVHLKGPGSPGDEDEGTATELRLDRERSSFYRQSHTRRATMYISMQINGKNEKGFARTYAPVLVVTQSLHSPIARSPLSQRKTRNFQKFSKRPIVQPVHSKKFYKYSRYKQKVLSKIL